MSYHDDHMDKSVEFVAKHYKPNAFDSRKGWEKMKQHIAPEQRVHKLSLFYSSAAAVALLLIIGILYFTADRNETLVAEKGNITFVLPDSSRVEIRKGSTLTYDRHFGKESRNVSMNGEVRFSVARDEGKPFVVETEKAQITVLGTEFNVKSDDETTSLDVFSGKVRFSPEDPVMNIICTSGMAAQYNATEKAISVTSGNSQVKINAKKNEIILNNAAIEQIIHLLSQYYNVELQAPKEERSLHLTTTFTQKSIIEIVNIINVTLDTHLTIVNSI